MLTVLETLGPVERAVFVLREVFDVPYDEIAEAVGKSPAATRQIGHRAREHVAARRPRMQVTRSEQQKVVERFSAAVTGGDVLGLLEVLAPDVIMVADSGGLAPSIRKAVEGASKVAQVLANFGRVASDAVVALVDINGAPAMRVDLGANGLSAIAFEFDGDRIVRIYTVRNPNKLERLDAVADLRR
jgi:RNA polymerase sigma-70 factor (ECF subfamily)